MKTLSHDTNPVTERVMMSLLRQTPASRKLEMWEHMTQTVWMLALSGVQQRHPDATPQEVQRHMAHLWLGDALAERVYTLGGGITRDMTNVNPEPIYVTLQVIHILDRLGIPYFIGGSLASAIHGVVRATRDAHIVAAIQPVHVAPLVQSLQSHFYVLSADITEALQRCGSFNIIHLETLFKVDIFLPKDRPYDQAQFGRRVAHVLSRTPHDTMYLCSVEDTILSKLEWFRLGNDVSERQWLDVLGVLKVQEPTLDRAYMQEWATILGVVDLLERAEEEAYGV